MTTTATGPESERIERARRGDADARAALVNLHYGAVYSLAFKLTGRVEAARDVAQETFLRAFARLDQHDPEYSFASWVFKIAANHVRDLHRRDVRAPEPPRPGEDPRAEAILEKREDLARVRSALESLPPDSRLPFILHLEEGLPIREIAYALDSTENGIRMKIYRALLRVRSLLREEP